MKSILVTGDWLADWNLAQPADLPEGYFEGSLQTQLHHRAGGAWYVAHLIENVACRDLTGPPTPSLTVTCLRDSADSMRGLNPQGTQRGDLAHAYSVWRKHRRSNAGKEEDQGWRIDRSAGCRKSTAWKPPVAGGERPPTQRRFPPQPASRLHSEMTNRTRSTLWASSRSGPLGTLPISPSGQRPRPRASSAAASSATSLHASEDFYGPLPGSGRLSDPVWTEELLVTLAKAGHAGYRRVMHGSSDDKDWDQLTASSQPDNLDPVPRRLMGMKELGWEAVPEGAAGNRERLKETDRQALHLAMLDREHRIWLSRRLAEGFAKGPPDQKFRRINTDIVPFQEVSKANQAINQAIIRETLDAFATAGFCLVKARRRNETRMIQPHSRPREVTTPLSI